MLRSFKLVKEGRYHPCITTDNLCMNFLLSDFRHHHLHMPLPFRVLFVLEFLMASAAVSAIHAHTNLHTTTAWTRLGHTADAHCFLLAPWRQHIDNRIFLRPLHCSYLSEPQQSIEPKTDRHSKQVTRFNEIMLHGNSTQDHLESTILLHLCLHVTQLY